MNGQAAAAPALTPTMTWVTLRLAFEAGIVNLKASIDRRAAVASSPPFDVDEFEALSKHIWETKVELAKRIRRFGDPVGAAILRGKYRQLIGTMPDDDGVIP